MPAANTDLLMEVGLPGTATTLSAPGYSIGGTSITVGSTTNWPTATGVTFAIDEAEVVDGEEVQVAGSYNEFVGTVATGTTVTNVDWVAGSGDRNYSAGALTRVYIPVSSERENRIVEWGTTEHKQNGTHGDVTADSVATDTVSEGTPANGVSIDGLNIKDSKLNTNNSVPAAALETTAIALGYAEITTSPSTTTSGTAVAISGLGASVTIPSGGRKVKITVYIPDVRNNNAAGASYISIWDGTVGSGTQLQEASLGVAQTASNRSPVIAQAVVTPSAGAKTYNIGQRTNGTGTTAITCASTAPAFVLVEAI